MTDAELISLLAANGLRNTADRRRILSLFMKDRAWTVAQVHENLKGMDLSTVYRNVNALTENGLLTVAAVQGKETSYGLASKGHHAHQVCQRCGTAFCIPCPIGGTNDEHALEIYTVCAACKIKTH
ncbi:MAG: Fur family transcriptional regulator [Patescibacteria group bacterium]|nr:Fur family transcriptional regulator [Patescibacteria group bacterium]